MSEKSYSDNVSEPTNDNVKALLKNDKIRYQRKGYGLITASLITITFFYYVPDWSYQVWPTLLHWCQLDIQHNQFNRFKMAILMIYVGHNVFFIIGQLMHFFLYKTQIQFFEKYKINPERLWPWEKDPEGWKVMIKKSLWSIFISSYIINFLMICIDNWVLNDIQMRMDLDSWPSKTEIVKQVVFFMFIEDLLFYWAHRCLHLSKVYPLIHKKHHEHKDPISISSEYAHWVEHILSNTLPTVAGYKLLANKVHLVTVTMWVAMRVTETIDGHSGFEFSWSPYRLLPFSGSASYHNYHHTHNVGNYSSFFTMWDTLCGTSNNYWAYLSRKQQKQNIKEIHLKNLKKQ